jgi:hypothetical protein
VSRTTGRSAEVLRQGSGIRVDEKDGDGLTISTHILSMPGISQRPPEPDLSSTYAEQ